MNKTILEKMRKDLNILKEAYMPPMPPMQEDPNAMPPPGAGMEGMLTPEAIQMLMSQQGSGQQQPMTDPSQMQQMPPQGIPQEMQQGMPQQMPPEMLMQMMMQGQQSPQGGMPPMPPPQEQQGGQEPPKEEKKPSTTEEIAAIKDSLVNVNSKLDVLAENVLRLTQIFGMMGKQSNDIYENYRKMIKQ